MPEEEKNFWKTLPGIITGIAALVTAATGLLIAFNQTGWFKKTEPQTQQVSAVVKPTESAPPLKENTSPIKPAETAQYDVNFAMTIIKAGDYDYTILESSLKPTSPDNRELKVKLRLMNNDRYQANFWNSTFRLSVDGVPTSPTGELNELVDDHAAKDGFVTFDVPKEAKELIFMIMDHDKAIKIPVEVLKK